MIARIWHGWTKPGNATAYEDMLRDEIFPSIAARNIKGYRGAELFIYKNGAEVEFITIMLWESIDAIRAVAGADYESAVIPEERRKYLARYDPKSAHYDVASVHGIGVM